MTLKSKENLSKTLNLVSSQLQHSITEAQTLDVQSVGLTAVSVLCAAGEQMVNGEMLVKWVVNPNALQSRCNSNCSEK